MRKLFVVVFILFTSVRLFATHLSGVEMTYKHLSGNKYEVTVSYYVDCWLGDTSLYPFDLRAISTCSADTIIVPVIVTKNIDITPIPELCNDSSLCKGGLPYGMMRVTHKGIVDLPTTCCEFVIRSGSYYSMKRATTFDNGQAIVAEITLNRCKFESSPVFESVPELFLRLNQPQHLSFKCLDSTALITYELFPPTSNPTGYVSQPIKYYTGFSYTKPFTVFGGIVPKRKTFPQGFFFDTLTGEMTFQPVIINQVTTTAVKAKKWKKINDTLRIVSESLRQIICEVIPGANNLPSFNSFENELIVCKDTGWYWFDIPLSDKDSSNTIYLSYTHQLGNRIQISETGTYNNKIVKIGYKVDSVVLNDSTIDLLTIHAADSACPLNGVNRKTFKFIVKPYLPDSFSISKTLTCRTLNLKLNNYSSVVTPNVNWLVISLQDTLETKQANAFFTLKDTGWYKIYLTVGSDEHCSKQHYYDSVYLSPVAFLELKVPADTSLCFNPVINLQATVINGTRPIKYNWSTGDTTSIITVSATAQTNQYWVALTDANNCSTAQDTVNVFYYNPKINLSGDKEVCIGNNIQLQATLSDTIKPTFSWVGFNNTGQLIDAPTKSRQYQFTLTDVAGCKIDTAWEVEVYAPKITFNHANDVCRGDSLIFSAQADSGKVPYTYNWISHSKTGGSITIPTQGLSLGFTKATLQVTDSFGCKVSGTTQAYVKPKPTINIQTVPKTCVTANKVDLTSYASPQGGIWKGKGITGVELTPQIADTGTHLLQYKYEDPNFNCPDSITTTITIEQNSNADFIADKTIAQEGDTINFVNNSTTKEMGQSRWNFGDPSSGGQNTYTGKETNHIYKDTGTYTVQLIVKGGDVCVDDTLIRNQYITITKKSNVGIAQLKYFPLKLYPNPAKDKLTVEIAEEIASLTLTDALGKVIKVNSTIINSTKAEIIVDVLPSGIYLIEAKDIIGKTYTGKVQISR